MISIRVAMKFGHEPLKRTPVVLQMDADEQPIGAVLTYRSGVAVFDPPPALAPMFALLLAGALVRVIAPLVDGADYIVWVAISQGLWMLGFGLFLIAYLPMLIRPRLDGRRG